MTPAVDVVRQFEVRVQNEQALNDVERAIDQALPATPKLQRRIHKVLRPPVLEVRLEGGSSLVADAMASIARLPGASVRNDVIRTPADGHQGLPFPDPGARVRIGVDSLPPSVTRGPAAPVTVAIVDSGIMVDHPRLANRLWRDKRGAHGKQFIKDPDGKFRSEDDIHDQDGHGTLLAGTVIDAAGDTPVELMVAKFFDSAHSARPDNATAALNYAVDNEAQIILLAWDVGLGSIALEKTFTRACQHALVVIAAGNYGSDNDWHNGKTLARAPVRYAQAAHDSTIVVMAADETGKAWFSNYGKRSVDMAAPGVNIISTRRCLTKDAAAGPLGTRTHGGTSAAAALVAGAAAQVMSRYPGLKVPQVKQSLTDSAGRRLDIAAALGFAESLARP